MRKVKVLLFLCICVWQVKAQGIFQAKDQEAQRKWVSNQMQQMSLEEKIGQLFMVAAHSNKGEYAYNAIEDLIRNHHIGGLMFMQGGPVRQAQLTNRYQSAAKVPLFMAIDGEWGLAMRLDSTISFPKQVTLGAIQDNRYIYNMGAEIARQCRLMGIHINFAPVVDVNSNPDNPVIGFRSFGENKENVAQKGIAYMKGMQENGVIANAKHFPGHGDTGADSHYTLPVIKHNKKRLEDVDLYPFRQLIADSLLSLMVAHIHIPAYDNTPNRATTLSKKVVTGLLKDKMNYQGLVFTDALNMKGVSQFYEPGEVDVKALMAGNDVLLYAEDVPKAVERIKAAVKQGEISQSEVEKHVQKILYAKYWAGLHQPQKVYTKGLYDKLNEGQGFALKQKLYEKAITIVHNEGNRVPFHVLDTNSFATLSLNVDTTTTFQKYLGKYAPMVHHQLSATKANDYPGLIEKLRHFKTVIVGVHGTSAYASKGYGIKKDNILLLEALQSYTNVVLVVFGNPYSLKQFGEFPNLICGYEDEPLAQKAAAQVLFGGIGASGKLPVSASANLPVGTGIDTRPLGRLNYGFPSDVNMNGKHLKKKIDDIAQEALASEATPGCQILIARQGRVIFEKNYGKHTYKDTASQVTDETIYDLASITKVAATLQAFMFLKAQNLIDLDKKASYYLPELKGTNKEDMIIRDILTHQAGLWPFLKHYENTLDKGKPDSYYYAQENPQEGDYMITPGLYGHPFLKDSVWQWTVHSKLREKDKKRKGKPYDYKYSDISFYILHRLTEKILNQPIEDFLDYNLYQPIGATTTGFYPTCRFPLSQIAPTEFDEEFRHALVHGVVHDPGAAMYDGVAGHAGLFSNANDLAKILQMNLQNGYYGGTQILPEGVVSLFSQQQYEPNRRGLGWDKPAVGDKINPASKYASSDAYGHTGFTGTSAWVDPVYDLVYIFLSNRVHPNASNYKLIYNDIRTRIQDVAYEAIFMDEEKEE